MTLDEKITEEYKDGKRPWQLEYPINLFEAVLAQARDDYITGYKLLIKLNDGHKPNLEKRTEIILKKSKKIDQQLQETHIARRLLHTWLKQGLIGNEVFDLLTSHKKQLSEEYASMDKEWDTLLMLEDVDRYMHSETVTGWVDAPSDDIIKEWQKDAMIAYKKEAGKPSKYTSNKLSDETIKQIWKLHDKGLKNKQIAEKLCISVSAVGSYVRERRDNENRKKINVNSDEA